MALHDLLGKKTGQPVCRLLGSCREIQTDITLSLDNPRRMAVAALAAVKNGFNHIKMKVGSNPRQDIARVQAVREMIGPDVSIRLDANQGWTVLQAIETLKKMEHYNPEFVEPPLVASGIKGLREVREHCSIPIMADESVSSLNDAQMLIEHEAVDLFNIKLMKCGGIVNSAKIISLAESAKIKCMIGCMCESRIGITAAVHLASALSNVQYADLDSNLLIKERVTLSGADIHVWQD